MKVYYCKKINTVKNGFTLVEILVVIAIMSILAAITLPVFFNMRTNDRKSTCASNMEALGRALTEYYQDYKKYPAGARPDYAMKVWANTTDAYQAIPLSNQPTTESKPPSYNVITIPPMNPTTGTSNLLCYPRSSLPLQYKVTIEINSVTTTPSLSYDYIWHTDTIPSTSPVRTGSGTVTAGKVTLFDSVKIEFTSTTSHYVGETWEFYTFVGNNMKLGGAFSNPYANDPAHLQLSYTVTISTGSTDISPFNPNYYTWSNDAGETGGPTLIQAKTSLPLNNGLAIQFNDAYGHYVGDNWTFKTGEAPFDSTANDPKGTCTWMDWKPRGITTLSADLNVGGTTVAVDSLGPFDVPCNVTISGFPTRIISVNPDVFPPTVTFKNPVSNTLSFPTGTDIIPVDNSYYHLAKYSYLKEDERRSEKFNFKTFNYELKNDKFNGFNNYGLSYLYFKYLKDEGIYLRSLNYLHCPTDIKTDRIDRTLLISKLRVNDLRDYRLFDPLLSGFNKYDFTYNYDQYINDIKKFDDMIDDDPTSIKPLDLHIHRQLSDKRPPSDTVVTWCFQHRGIKPDIGPYSFNPDVNTFLSTDGKTYITPDGQPVGTKIVFRDKSGNPLQSSDDPENYDYDGNGTTINMVDKLMADYKNQRDVVLWLDGSSGTVTPQIVKSSKGKYYWLPTFLTSSAEQR